MQAYLCSATNLKKSAGKVRYAVLKPGPDYQVGRTKKDSTTFHPLESSRRKMTSLKRNLG